MTVNYQGEDPEDRSARNELGVRTYTRGFWLETTDQSDTAYDVGSHGSLPVIGSTFPDDSSAWCRSLDVQCVKGWKVWKVTANYSSELELNTTATSDPAIITWDSEQFQKPAVVDTSGNGITNSAGDPFLPPEMMDDSRRIVTVRKNLAAVPSWILTYQDAVNSDSFTVDGVTIGIGKAKMQRVSVSEVQRRGSTTFRTVEFQIHLQKDGWLLNVLDQGFRELDGTDRKHILNKDKTRITTPVLLDGSGARLSNPTSASAVYLSYTVYTTLAFSSLPLT